MKEIDRQYVQAQEQKRKEAIEFEVRIGQSRLLCLLWKYALNVCLYDHHSTTS